jgi:hypothetical protein
MQDATANPETRDSLQLARKARSHAFNDALGALFGRKPRPDHHG